MNQHAIRAYGRYTATCIFAGLILCGCTPSKKEHPESGTYGYDRYFLNNYIDLVELTNGDAKILVAPAYQGRVMTSTCTGDTGKSFGWINYELISSGKIMEHMNPYGGEERLWLGPEGGQFAVFFPPGAPFDFAHWQTPADFDSEPFQIVSHDSATVICSRSFSVLNWSNTSFQVEVRRTVHLLSEREMMQDLSVRVPAGVRVVGYSSDNVLINRGDTAWQKETGLLSVWMLEMMRPSPSVTIVLPIEPGSEAAMGPRSNTQYFGPIPPSRIAIRDSVIYFKADGKMRGKLGISPRRARPVVGSYDAQNHVLTLLHCRLPSGPDATTSYVNSLWAHQDNPYGGDAINAYNDGPLDNGSQLGPFYELESSSPAAGLVPGDSIAHHQSTYHFMGDELSLNDIALKTLGVSLDEIQNALP